MGQILYMFQNSITGAHAEKYIKLCDIGYITTPQTLQKHYKTMSPQ